MINNTLIFYRKHFFDNIPSMHSPFIQTLQKFQYTASSQDVPDHYIPPLTTSKIFMKTCKQSAPSSVLSFSQQKSSIRTQPLTYSQTTSGTYAVENICNQIKYLIEGNLRTNNSQSSKMDFVRQNIIPMLIKMFFQSSKTEDSIQSSFGNQKQQFKDITNNFGAKVKPWKTQTFNGQQSSEGFYDTVKSDFIRKTNLEEQQNSENDESKNEQNQKSDLESQVLNQQFSLTKTLCLSILLLKALVVRKSCAFQKIKSFGQQKQKKVLWFVNFVKQTRVKRCINKFCQNISQTEKQTLRISMELQSRKLNEKQMNLSCQVIGKIVKMRIRTYFKLFKENSFSQNKWMNQWVRYAALRSPLTVKTSIWRFKQFLTSDNPQQKIYSQNSQSQSHQESNPKATEPDISQISQSQQDEESISSNEFEKMFQDEEEDQAIKRPSLEILPKENSINKNILENLVQWKKTQENDEYLRTISEDQQECSSACQ